jgi:hypothetical protein
LTRKWNDAEHVVIRKLFGVFGNAEEENAKVGSYRVSADFGLEAINLLQLTKPNKDKLSNIYGWTPLRGSLTPFNAYVT